MNAARFSHEAIFYADRDEFLAGTLPFLRGALEAGEPSLVAVRRANAVTLRGELGPDADGIRFADMEELGRNPARIVPLWRDFVDASGGLRAHGIGEPVWPQRSAAEIDECQRMELLLNVAFAGPPAWRLLCPYDSRALDDGVLEAARTSHPFVPAAAANPHAGALSAPPPGARRFTFDRSGLSDARELVALEARAARMSTDRAFDLVVAAGEILANSLIHGGGTGLLRVWQEDGTLLVDVEDGGWIQEPLVGRVRPQPSQEGGRGLWLANHLCDLVQIRSGPSGTAVRLRVMR